MGFLHLCTLLCTLFEKIAFAHLLCTFEKINTHWVKGWMSLFTGKRSWLSKDWSSIYQHVNIKDLMVKHQQDRLEHLWVSSSFAFRELFWMCKISADLLMQKKEAETGCPVNFLNHWVTHRSHTISSGIKTCLSFPFTTSTRYCDFSFCGEWHVEWDGIKWYNKCQPSIEQIQSNPKP